MIKMIMYSYNNECNDVSNPNPAPLTIHNHTAKINNKMLTPQEDKNLN